ncbi:DUF3514 domain-containing protein [Ehrlichia sp. JZT12]
MDFFSISQVLGSISSGLGTRVGIADEALGVSTFPGVSHAKQIAMRKIWLNSEEKKISSVSDEESSIMNAASGDAVKKKGELAQYLKQSIESRVNSVLYVGYIQKGLIGLYCMELDSEKDNICYIADEESSIISTASENIENDSEPVRYLEQGTIETDSGIQKDLTALCSVESRPEKNDVFPVVGEENSVISASENVENGSEAIKCLKQSVKLETDSGCIPSIGYTQEGLMGLYCIKPGLRKESISSIAVEESSILDTNKKKDRLNSDRLRQSTKSKTGTSSVQYVTYAQKVSVGLHNVKISSKKQDLSSISSKENFVTDMVSKDAIEEKNKLESQGLGQSTRQKINTNSISHVTYAQKVLVGLNSLEPDLEKKNIFSVTSKENSVTKTVSRDDLEKRCQYLKQGAKAKTGANSVPYVSYAQKVASQLPVKSSLEKSNVSSVKSDGSTTANIVPKHVMPSSCIDFKEESGVISVASNDALIQSDSMGVNYYQCNRESRSMLIDFCHALKEYKSLHSSYCVKLIYRIFRIKGSKLVISNKVKNFLSKHTSNVEMLIFIIKVSLLVNLATIYSGNKLTNNMRYCAKYFYDSSLLDNLMLDIIRAASERKSIENIVRLFVYYCDKLPVASCYEPYSSDFFEQIFLICYNFALIDEYEGCKELVHFIVWSCMIYCGSMVGMVCKMFVNNCAIENLDMLLKDKFRSYVFSRRCYDLKNALMHAYHPIFSQEGKEIVRNVAGLNVPFIILRNCTNDIGIIVADSIGEGKLSFGIFVRNMIARAKRSILTHGTKYFYMEDIKSYSAMLKTVDPLPLKRDIHSKRASQESYRYL